jgi:hypothetical protein
LAGFTNVEPVITCCEPDDHVPTRVEGFDCATTWIDARVRRARELANIVELRVLMRSGFLRTRGAVEKEWSCVV